MYREFWFSHFVVIRSGNFLNVSHETNESLNKKTVEVVGGMGSPGIRLCSAFVFVHFTRDTTAPTGKHSDQITLERKARTNMIPQCICLQNQRNICLAPTSCILPQKLVESAENKQKHNKVWSIDLLVK